MKTIAAVLAYMFVVVPALADDATGLWLRSDGVAKVKVSPCGPALCGTVAWVRDADKRKGIGLRVFIDMMPAGDNAWKGKAFNPEDGRTYTGKMVLSGDRLTTAGCVLGGLICKSFSWLRVR